MVVASSSCRRLARYQACLVWSPLDAGVLAVRLASSFASVDISTGRRKACFVAGSVHGRRVEVHQNGARTRERMSGPVKPVEFGG